MISRLFKLPSAFVQSNSYNPSIDGLRFFAFLLVFVHHAPLLKLDFMATLKRSGWMGVDLFFVISTYLLFSNLIREREKTGRVDTGRYFARRFLRIYPLMVVYILAMLIIFGPVQPDWPLNLAGVLLFFDNILSWHIGGLNNSIVAANHLWTLSFEFQIYVVLPLLLVAYLKVGARGFLIALGAYAIAAAVARWWLYGQGLAHPQVYVTPVFRPEAVFVGLLLAIHRPRWHWGFSLVAAIIAVACIVILPRPWEAEFAAVTQYPLIALAAGAIMDVALRSPPVRTFLAFRPFVALGAISYGLYVFHYYARYQMRQWSSEYGFARGETVWDWLTFTGGMMAIALVLAIISYTFLEKPFLKLKIGAFVPKARLPGARPSSHAL